MTSLAYYSGERYVWSLGQAARAAGKYPTYPATWQGLEALQSRVAMSGVAVGKDDAMDMPWARAAFADASARFNWKYEEVVA